MKDTKGKLVIRWRSDRQIGDTITFKEDTITFRNVGRLDRAIHVVERMGFTREFLMVGGVICGVTIAAQGIEYACGVNPMRSYPWVTTAVSLGLLNTAFLTLKAQGRQGASKKAFRRSFKNIALIAIFGFVSEKAVQTGRRPMENDAVIVQGASQEKPGHMHFDWLRRNEPVISPVGTYMRPFSLDEYLRNGMQNFNGTFYVPPSPSPDPVNPPVNSPPPGGPRP